MSIANYIPVIINAGQTKPVNLKADPSLLNNLIAVTTGTAGVLEFRHRVLNGQWETAEAPNTLDLATKKSISFNGAPLEAIEIKNTGAQSVTVTITQY